MYLKCGGSRHSLRCFEMKFDTLDRGEKTIAATRKSFDIGGLVGRVGESLPQFVDRFVEAVFEVDKSLAGPKALLNLVPGNDRAGVFEKQDEDFKRLAGETKLDTMFAELTGGDVNFEGFKAIEKGGLGRNGGTPSGVRMQKIIKRSERRENRETRERFQRPFCPMESKEVLYLQLDTQEEGRKVNRICDPLKRGKEMPRVREFGCASPEGLR